MAGIPKLQPRLSGQAGAAPTRRCSPGTRARLSTARGTVPGCRSAGSRADPRCTAWPARSGWCRLEGAGCSAPCAAGSRNSHRFWCSVPTHLLPSWEGKWSQTLSTVNLPILYPWSKLIQWKDSLPKAGGWNEMSFKALPNPIYSKILSYIYIYVYIYYNHQSHKYLHRYKLPSLFRNCRLESIPSNSSLSKGAIPALCAQLHSQGLCALLQVAHPTDGLWLFAAFAEAPMNHLVVTLPAAPILGVLEPWETCQRNQKNQVLVRMFGLNRVFWPITWVYRTGILVFAFPIICLRAMDRA